MILNQFLPPEVLQNTVKKETFENMDFILDSLDETKTERIFKNSELLGNIHHAVNLDKYSKKSFRKMLFSYAPPPIKNRYFKFCGIKKNILKMTKKEYQFQIKKVVFFEWGDNPDTRNFVKFFKYPDYIIFKKSKTNAVKEKVFGGYSKKNEFKPLDMILDYQAKIVFEALPHLKIPSRRILIQMPTGTGKTRTAMEIISHYMNKNKNSQVVWITDSSELLDQAADTFKQIWMHVGKVPIDMYRIWGTRKVPKINKENSIVFAGYSKLSYLLKKSKNILSPDLVILDESHRILAPDYSHSLDTIKANGENTRIIGLTATPGRGIAEEQNDLLVQKFRNRIIRIKFDDKEIIDKYEDNVVEYLEDSGVLSRAVSEPLETDLEFGLSDDEWRKLSALFVDEKNEFDEEFLKKIANDNRRNILIVEKIKEYVNMKKKILYFSVDLEQSVLVFALLLKLGITAVHIHGETDKDFREKVIEKFKNTNEIQVICNYNIFSTGFDVPNLDVVFIGRPVNSPVLFNQMVGRGTRGKIMGGDETFTLVQVVDKITAGNKNFDAYRNYAYWDKNWKTNDE